MIYYLIVSGKTAWDGQVLGSFENLNRAIKYFKQISKAKSIVRCDDEEGFRVKVYPTEPEPEKSEITQTREAIEWLEKANLNNLINGELRARVRAIAEHNPLACDKCFGRGGWISPDNGQFVSCVACKGTGNE